MKTSLTILSLMLSVNAHAQSGSPVKNPNLPVPSITVVVQDESKWEDYFYPGEEFVVMLPEMPAVTRQSENEETKRAAETSFSAYSNGIVYVVIAHEARGDGGRLDARISDIMSSHNSSTRLRLKKEMTLGKFPGKQFVIDRSSLEDTMWFYGTDSRTYMLRAVGAPDTHPDVQRFIQSLRLTNKPAGKKIEKDLPPLVESQSAGNIVAPRSVGNDAAPASEQSFRHNEVTSKAILILKPEPGYTRAARENNVAGVVRLQAVLGSSGRVERVKVVKHLPDGLTENAIAACRKIKFIPAMKDGRRVSQYVVIEYNFNVY